MNDRPNNMLEANIMASIEAQKNLLANAALTKNIVGARSRRSCSPIGGSMFSWQMARPFGFTMPIISRGKMLVANGQRSNE